MDDQPQVLELLRLNTPEYFAPEETADFIEYLEREAEYYFVIEEDKRIVACGGYNLMSDGITARISWDMVHPEVQGKGLGRRLTQFRIDDIKKHSSIELIVVRTSQLAYQFYAKFGFTLAKKVPDFWAKGFHLYQMEMKV